MPEATNDARNAAVACSKPAGRGGESDSGGPKRGDAAVGAGGCGTGRLASELVEKLFCIPGDCGTAGNALRATVAGLGGTSIASTPLFDPLDTGLPNDGAGEAHIGGGPEVTGDLGSRLGEGAAYGREETDMFELARGRGGVGMDW